jgi:hypothetical protein
MGTNCAPLLFNWFLYSLEADFMQGLLKENKKKLIGFLHSTFWYIGDVLSLHDSKFGEYIDRIYPI